MSGATDMITALTAAMVPAGGAIAFLWNKIERRFAKLEGEQEVTELHLEACRRAGALKLTVIELLFQELRRVSPESWLLDRASDMLKEARRIDEEEAERSLPHGARYRP